jgi:predicted DNA-binding transcriptional regulator YafY
VNNFDGIGRFVLGLIDEIKIIEPKEFRDHIRHRISQQSS